MVWLMMLLVVTLGVVALAELAAAPSSDKPLSRTRTAPNTSCIAAPCAPLCLWACPQSPHASAKPMVSMTHAAPCCCHGNSGRGLPQACPPSTRSWSSLVRSLQHTSHTTTHPPCWGGVACACLSMRPAGTAAQHRHRSILPRRTGLVTFLQGRISGHVYKEPFREVWGKLTQ
jgi:hypothetical protein